MHSDSMHSSVKEFLCHRCDRGFSTKGGLKSHLNVDHGLRYTFICSACGRSFADRLSLKRHLNAVHTKLKKFPCTECKRTFSRKPNMQTHMDAVHKKLKTCECNECGRKFSRKEHLKIHLNSVHAKRDQLTGGECQLGFTDKTSLKTRSKRVHGNTEDSSEQIVAVKTEEVNIKTEVVASGLFDDDQQNVVEFYEDENHSSCAKIKPSGEDVKPYACSNCASTFDDISHLSQHLKTHYNEEERFVCGESQGAAADSLALNFFNSESKRSNSKKFQCHHCNRAFPTKGGLKSHLNCVHGRRRYICGKCSRFFADKGSLERHLNAIHMKLKKFRCPKCARVFSLKLNLKTHIDAVHKKLKKCECSECGRIFSGKGRLTAHLNSALHTKRGQFTDGECQRGFTDKTSLKTHSERVHGNTERSRGQMVAVNTEEEVDIKTEFSEPDLFDDNQRNVVEFYEGEINLVKGGACNSFAKLSYATIEPSGDDVKPFAYEEKKFASAESDDSPALRMHLDLMLSNSKNLQCHHCDRIFSTRGDLKSHLDFIHGQYKFICGECGRSFADRLPLKRHLNAMHRNLHKFKCPDCAREFSLKTNLKAHIDAVHRKLKKCECGECGRKFSRRGHLKVHLEAVHAKRERSERGFTMHRVHGNTLSEQAIAMETEEEVDIKPEFVDSDFFDGEKRNIVEFYEGESNLIIGGACNTFAELMMPSDDDLKPHASAFPEVVHLSENIETHHSKEKKFICGVCRRAFPDFPALSRHLDSMHDSVKDFQCHHCDRAFSMKDDLKSHLNFVHGQYRFICGECGRSFAVRGSLKIHLNAVHRKVKKFQCPECNRAFSLKLNLNSHVDAVHRKLKRYKCGDCGRPFARKSQLKMHLGTVHTIRPKIISTRKVEKFICSDCGREFTKKLLLQDHLKLQHGNTNKFSCEECNCVFSNKRALETHASLLHSANESSSIAGVCPPNWVPLTNFHRLLNLISPAYAKKFSCSDCGREFTNKLILQNHLSELHSATKFLCQYCNCVFSDKRALESHVALLHSENESPSSASAGLPNWVPLTSFHRLLDTNITSARDAKKFVCKECGSVFLSRRDLNYHSTVIHMKWNTSPCVECGRIFINREYLKIHLKTVHQK